MASFKLIRGFIKFQLCVGYFPDGRMRTRTFGIGGVRPDLSADDVAAVAHAVAPLLAHPVVRVRFVRKYALETPLRQRAGIAPKAAQRRAVPASPCEPPLYIKESFVFTAFPRIRPPKPFWRKNCDVV